ncbi:AraC family transcriptional regulator [Nocardiopsis sp. CNT-189]|uniref:helix-turn-helix transcriptional regulator n=1 Tax=Nocardiopsis oceanisediminis TaxID=2816862 RepID=UPI003B324ADB
MPTVRTETTATGHLDIDEAFETWHERVSFYHHGVDSVFPDGVRRFQSDALRVWTDNHQVLSWHSDGVRHQKTQRHLREAPTGDPFLLVCSSGTLVVEQSGEQILLRKGQACVFTMARPFTFEQPEHSGGLALSLERRPLETTLFGRRPPCPVDLGTGVGRIAHSMAAGLIDHAPELTPDEFDAVAERTTDLLCMALRGQNGMAEPGGRLAEIAAAAQRHVRLHADDPGLRGETLAADLGWSLRQVQLALQTVGTTPRRLIKDTRLAQARELLTDPRNTSMPVSEVARRVGFISASTFSAAFRDRYGASPRLLRSARVNAGDPV